MLQRSLLDEDSFTGRRNPVGLHVPQFTGNDNVVACKGGAVFFRGVVDEGFYATGAEVFNCEVFGWSASEIEVGLKFVRMGSA